MDLLSCLISALFLLVVAIAFSEWDKHKRAGEIRKSLDTPNRGIPDGSEDPGEGMRELNEIRREIESGRTSLTTAAGIKAAMTVDDVDSRDFS
jgi:hypothetical protein